MQSNKQKLKDLIIEYSNDIDKSQSLYILPAGDFAMIDKNVLYLADVDWCEPFFGQATVKQIKLIEKLMAEFCFDYDSFFDDDVIKYLPEELLQNIKRVVI